MTKKFGVSLLKRNEKKSERKAEKRNWKRTSAIADSFEEAQALAITQVKECEDGRALAKLHSENRRLLAAAVMGLMKNLACCENCFKKAPENVWDYLEVGLQLIGFKQESALVKSNFMQVAATLSCPCRGCYVSETLFRFLNKSNPTSLESPTGA